MVVYRKTNKIQVICPICKKIDIIGFPETRLNKTSQLTTISVHKGLICPHHFQFFMDKSFQIRGYQKVDFELHQENSINLRNGVKAFNEIEKEGTDNFENLILEGNKVKYIPINGEKNRKIGNFRKEVLLKKKKNVLREIYDEFWEFIDEKNEKFLELIKQDKRRINFSINSDLKEICII